MVYAAVVSLKQKMERLLLVDPSLSEIFDPDPEARSIFDELSYLQSLLEKINSLPISSKRTVDIFAPKFKDALKKFEVVIDSRLSSRLHSGSEISIDESFRLVATRQLSYVWAEVCLFIMLKMKEYKREEEKQRDYFASDAFPIRTDIAAKRVVVGLDYELQELEYWALWGTYEPNVILIVGMAGIGKTTLIKEFYYSPLVVSRFKHRLFLPIGPHYSLKQILLLALDQLGEQVPEKADENSLGECIYKCLVGKLYLAVLDDIWDSRVWDDLKHFFPDNDDTSRIVLTSRLVVDFTDRDSIVTENIFHKSFLDDGESWNLLREIVVFTAQEPCSRELEKIGRKIAKNCEGLPLAIIQVGDLLRKTEKTVEEWTKVAENEDPLVIKSDDFTPLSKALFLSYRMLPEYLKVCFLYMGVFPKNDKISRSKLFRLWATEGFLEQPETDKSLETIADERLRGLVSQSVVLNKETRSIDTSATKICRLHFTFRSLSVNEAKKEKLFYVINKYNDSFPDEIDSQQRLCIHNNVVLSIEEVHSWMESVPDASSFLCLGPKQQYPIELYLPFRLLKVLDAVSMRFYEFPHQVLQLVELMYFAITFDGELPASISRLLNLEALIIHRHHRIIESSNSPVYLPIEIWKLHKLKNLECMGFDLPDPSSTDDDSLVLRNILTVSGVSSHTCTQRILARMPNLIKLGIQIESAPDSVETFSFLGADHFASVYEEFESFKCVFIHPRSLISSSSKVGCSVPINFPVNIKKISLSGCAFPWEYIGVIAPLPNLLVLKLRCNAFCGAQWKTYNGGFAKLEVLLLEDLDIQSWEIDSGDHFPCLKHLLIRHCYKLGEIPSQLKYLIKLELIEIVDCTHSVAVSAPELQRKMLPWVKDDPQIRIRSSWDDKKPKP